MDIGEVARLAGVEIDLYGGDKYVKEGDDGLIPFWDLLLAVGELMSHIFKNGALLSRVIVMPDTTGTWLVRVVGYKFIPKAEKDRRRELVGDSFDE